MSLRFSFSFPHSIVAVFYLPTAGNSCRPHEIFAVEMMFRRWQNHFGMQSASKPVKCITPLFLKDNYRRCDKRSSQRLFQLAVRHRARAVRNGTPFIGRASFQ
ncbi:hypothetical protein EHZ19_01275 [Paraburkholderia bannensis]|nr:hypothetical protein [Paraburkholderia bannensis]RQM50801.1 hypothetical protein EHZ19_01275 [Paraburkholderia bannensis]